MSILYSLWQRRVAPWKVETYSPECDTSQLGTNGSSPSLPGPRWILSRGDQCHPCCDHVALSHLPITKGFSHLPVSRRAGHKTYWTFCSGERKISDIVISNVITYTAYPPDPRFSPHKLLHSEVWTLECLTRPRLMPPRETLPRWAFGLPGCLPFTDKGKKLVINLSARLKWLAPQLTKTKPN